MKRQKLNSVNTIRWRKFDGKSYSIFRSIKREINIGVLMTATLVFANTQIASAQSEEPSKLLRNHELDEVEIVANRVPLTDLQSARPVTVITREQIKAAPVQTVNDLLKYAVGVDVRQRSSFGIQTDISLRGGTFDQVTVLLNGININSPQTGHVTTDFPVSMDDIERIEILEGPAARVYGTSAFSGAINIITKSDKKSHVALHAMGGEYGLFTGGARVNFSNSKIKNQLSANYSRSDGATENSDFSSKTAFYQGEYNSKEVDVAWHLGLSDKVFGANTFYSAAYPNQYEETQKIYTAVRATTKGKLHFSPSIYWNRGNDNFQLIKGTNTGENFHQTDVFGINLNTYFTSFLGKTSFGAEFRNEGILSTNLGDSLDVADYVKISGEDKAKYTQKANRTNIGYYLEHNILLKNFTFSFGILANMNTALDHQYRFYPGIDVSYRPSNNLKFFLSWNKALRMPTFTDLYYKGPTSEGSKDLMPENNEAFSVGAKYRVSGLNLTTNLFYNKGKNMIDWVMFTADDKFHSANFELENMGVEAQAQLNFFLMGFSNPFVRTINLGYSYIHQNRIDNQEIYKSSYALEYLRHKFVAQVSHNIWSKLSATWALRFQDREGGYIKYEDAKSTNQLVSYSPYTTIDLKLQWAGKDYKLFAEANNLLNKTYYDLGNVPQPGLWLRVGANWRINF